MYRTLFTLLTLLLIFSCKKEEDPSIFYDCTELLTPIEQIDLNNCPNPTMYPNSDLPFYRYPVFNPLNFNELIFFHKKENNNFFWEMWRYNICNGSHFVISDSVYSTQIDWSPQNWILYSNYNDNGKLYKVRANQKRGEKISEIRNIQIVKWKTDGTGYMLAKNGFNSSTLSLFDNQNNLITNLTEISPEASDWKGNQVVYGEYPNLKLLNLENSEITELVYDNSSVMMSVHFFKENHVLWNTSKKIAYTNLATLEHTIIKEAQPNQTFYHLDLSLDEQTIILDQALPIEVDDCVFEIKGHLTLMNIDGTNERRLLLPE